MDERNPQPATRSFLPFLTYQVDGDTGFITTTTSIGTLNSPRRVANTTDWANRHRTTTRPGPPIDAENRHPDIVTTYHYDPTTGQLDKTSASVGHAPILHLGDALGATTHSGLDVNADDELASSDNDRVTTRRAYYRQTDNHWWQITEDTVWITSAQSQTTRTAWLMSAADGETQSITRNFGTACASTTTITRSYDRSTHTITTTTNGPGGSYSSTATTDRNGVRVVATAVPDITNPADPQAAAREVHVYDAFGRLTRHTDPRGATTFSFHYNGTNQPDRVTDQLGRSTNYTYYPPGHANAGMEQTVADSGGGTTTYTYNPRGQLDEITGNQLIASTMTTTYTASVTP